MINNKILPILNLKVKNWRQGWKRKRN